MASIPYDKQSFGEAGCVVVTGTDEVTGDFCAIHILEATTFTTITNILASGDALTGFSIPAGIVLYGKFSDFELLSGKVIAYKSAPLK